MTAALEFETELDAAPETVWRALTEPELVDAWLGPISPETGGPGKVLEADAPRFLRLAWQGADGDSEVAFTVSPTETGSHLRILHTAPAEIPAANDDAPAMPMMRAA